MRWCSASLKVDVADRALRGQDRFLNRRTLMVTGERAEESPARTRYATFEPHRTDTRNGGVVVDMLITGDLYRSGPRRKSGPSSSAGA